MKAKRSLVSVCLLAACGLSACASAPVDNDAQAVFDKPRNVILFIADGMGFSYVKAYRAYADDPATPIIDPLPFDALLVGAIATDSIVLDCAPDEPDSCVRDVYGVTDSAASATAYATGRDTLNGVLSMGPDGERYPTVLEQAAAAGMGTGVVSTSQVTHASPAAFVAHVAARRDYGAIADQFLDNQIDGRPVAQVILGGGTRDFRREDRDVAQALVDDMGYTLLETAEDLESADGERLLGLFASVGLPRNWDRPRTVPTLAAMTEKAIATLARNDRGFFLVVEGSQVDWAGHGNDIAGVVSEMEGFTEAVQVGLDFAAGRDDTLLVITADHETGGLSIGRDGIYAWNPRPLRGLKATPEGMVEAFAAGDDSLPAVLEAHSSLMLTLPESASLDAAGRDPEAAYGALVDVLNRRTLTGWTTSGHTGVDVPLYATGPGSEALRGTLENEALGQQLLEWIGREPLAEH